MGPESKIEIWQLPVSFGSHIPLAHLLSVSSCASTIRIVSSTSTRNLRGVEPTSSVTVSGSSESVAPTVRETATARNDLAVHRQGLRGPESGLRVSFGDRRIRAHITERTGTAVDRLATVVLCGLSVHRSCRGSVATAIAGGRSNLGVEIDNALGLVGELAYQL